MLVDASNQNRADKFLEMTGSELEPLEGLTKQQEYRLVKLESLDLAVDLPKLQLFLAMRTNHRTSEAHKKMSK